MRSLFVKLRNPADRRTVLWVLCPPTLIALQYANPSWVPFLLLPTAYFALACGIIAHNHNHCPTFKSRRVNFWFGSWISIFYGYPTFAWIPTHNNNHHKFVNAEGDATITWRYTNRHNVFVAASYFFVSSYWQAPLINDFIRKAKTNNPKLYRDILTQYAVWASAHLGMMAVGVGLYGLGKGLLLWTATMGLPAFFSLWTIMLFNYDQHAHTDASSRYAHSRSFHGKVLNFLLFNNGYHLVHHDHPGTHWSEYARLHAEVAHRIPPELNQRSLFWYWFKQYALAPLFPRLGTTQMVDMDAKAAEASAQPPAQAQAA